jgi:arylsulfatase A
MILMLDDAGWADLGVYGSRSKTPNMDRLAAEGMRFTDCHAAAPNCSPSRIGMLTGRSPIRAGIFNYLNEGTPMHLQAHEVTIANLLHDAGYATGHFGKWHVSKLLSEQAQPMDHGYDYYLGTDNNAEPSHLNPDNFIRNGRELGMIKGYSCDIVADEAIGWLKAHVSEKEERPFFTTVWFHEPHEKIASPPDLVAEYKKRYPGIDNKEAEYLANVANADQAVGRILKTLTDLKLDKDTVVFCTSDNGGVNAWSNKGLRGFKSNMWEGGHREPGIFRWPGKIKAGTVSDQIIGFVDILPTFCEIAGIDLPKNRYLDGESIKDHLLTGTRFTREKPLFWFFYRVNPSMAFRMGDWLLISNTTDSNRPKTHAISREDIPEIKSAGLVDFQLFNLKTDLGQTTNVLDKNRKVFETMKTEMIRVHKEIVTEGKHWDLPVQKGPKKPIGT